MSAGAGAQSSNDATRVRSIMVGLAASVLAMAVAVAAFPMLASADAPQTLGSLLASHREEPLDPGNYTADDLEAARAAVRAGVAVSDQIWSAWLIDEVALDFDIDDDLVFFDDDVRTLCGERGPELGPFYCSTEDRIYYPDQFAVAAGARWGNWSNVWFASHEYGHNIQYDSNQGVPAGERVLAWEQQADCQSGAVMGYLLENDVITNVEIAEMLEAIEYVGDTHDVAEDAADAHGSSKQRVGVFYRGLRGWSCQLSSFG